MEKLRLDILDQERKIIFQKLSAFHPVGYLAGGTALALQIGHRVSYVLTFFVRKKLAENFRLKSMK